MPVSSGRLRLPPLLLLMSLSWAAAAPAPPVLRTALRGGQGLPQPLAGAEVWALPSDDGRLVAQMTDRGEEMKPAGAGDQDPEFQRLAAMAFFASLVALLLSVLAIAMLCRLLGAAKQIELIDLARQGAITSSVPTPVEMGGSKQKGNSISYHSYDQQAARRASLRPPAATAKENAQRRLSRHFEDFHGMPPLAGGGAGESQESIGGAPDFNGVWECVETFGLDDFLKAIKVGRVRRMAASQAPWPSWQFTQNGLDITYINKGKLGTMTEAFKADGSEYKNKDLEGNESTCKATLTGGVLKIERVGKQGRCFETRTQEGDGLHFVLEMEGIEVKWGRRFVRKPGSRNQGKK